MNKGLLKLGGEANETDRSLLEGGTSEQNSSHLRTTLPKAVEAGMENPQKVLMHPVLKVTSNSPKACYNNPA